MSTLTVNGSAVKKMTFKDSSGKEQKVKKWYHNDVKVFSSGNICTYYVDTGDLHTEEIDGEESCLTPKTFAPSKTGYIFVGWREDNTASSSVLSEKAMGEDPISLYAVFKTDFSLSFVNNYASGGSMNPLYGTQYYNNGNVVNPTVTLPNDGYSRSGISFIKWVLGNPGTQITLTGNTSTRAVCKYPDLTDNNYNLRDYGGGAYRNIDGSKYSQLIIIQASANGGNVWVDRHGTHTIVGYMGSAQEFANNDLLLAICSGVFGGYAAKSYNGVDCGDGGTEFAVSNITVNLPSNNVRIGVTDDYNNWSVVGAIKLIGRTVS